MAASQPSVVGHRGCAAHAPENTLGGFGRAAELGCDWVEFDVQLSRDGVPVVVHDPNLERTTGLDMPVRFLVARRIAELDAGSWFGPEWRDERVPTLAQTLDTCAVLGLMPNIEIKNDCGALRRCARAVAAVVAERWPAAMGRPLISSFSLRALYWSRLANADQPLALLMWRKPVKLWRLHTRLLRCRAVHVDASLASEALIGRAHRRGLKVGVYTVNDPELAATLRSRGADYIFSDNPESVVAT